MSKQCIFVKKQYKKKKRTKKSYFVANPAFRLSKTYKREQEDNKNENV